jgi:hypothetical protein
MNIFLLVLVGMILTIFILRTFSRASTEGVLLWILGKLPMIIMFSVGIFVLLPLIQSALFSNFPMMTITMDIFNECFKGIAENTCGIGKSKDALTGGYYCVEDVIINLNLNHALLNDDSGNSQSLQDLFSGTKYKYTHYNWTSSDLRRCSFSGDNKEDYKRIG